jgi:hypothetical protein
LFATANLEEVSPAKLPERQAEAIAKGFLSSKNSPGFKSIMDEAILAPGIATGT